MHNKIKMRDSILILFYIILTIPVAIIGSDRQLGLMRSIFIGLLVTSVIGLMLVLFSPKKLQVSHYKILRKCSDCGNDSEKGYCEKCSNEKNWNLVSQQSYNHYHQV